MGRGFSPVGWAEGRRFLSSNRAPGEFSGNSSEFGPHRLGFLGCVFRQEFNWPLVSFQPGPRGPSIVSAGNPSSAHRRWAPSASFNACGRAAWVAIMRALWRTTREGQDSHCRRGRYGRFDCAPRCNPLRPAATRCNSLQPAATRSNSGRGFLFDFETPPKTQF